MLALLRTSFGIESKIPYGKYSYGETGYIIGVLLQTKSSLLYNVLDWHSSKQSRISFSSIGCEFLAAAASVDLGSSMVHAIQLVHDSPSPLPLVLTVDSLGLYSTITTLHEWKDYRLRPTRARLRDHTKRGRFRRYNGSLGTAILLML